MIIYFSGTGNSAYVARRIAQGLGDEALDLFERLRDHDYTPLGSDRPWVVVAPTYAWRLPRFLADWLRHTELTGSRDVTFVLTCGGGIGNAGCYAARLCTEKGMTHKGTIPVVMPENYIALFNAPEPDEARRIIEAAEPAIDRAIETIASGKAFAPARLSLVDRLESGIVNDLFYPLVIHAKKFVAGEGCTSCGRCERVCPLSNVCFVDGHPVWGDHCTHCMACICRCPVGAIEYGKASVGKPRYTCPK
ncbi:MAG: EFR1 family ferrodoxin [Coriobacteriia bacterium]|nr:EFR1 family ferrodoxin [Coriobacteriia bacterium]